ncbi:MAG: glycoside hydrolase family 26 protein, partial [Candidatus Margulisiibacteriota bacterium]
EVRQTTTTITTTTIPSWKKIPGNFSGCAVGAFVNGMQNLDSFQTMVGKKLAVVLWYVHWFDPFPSSEADIVWSNGSIPLITWEPWISWEVVKPLATLEAIASGSFESYVRSFLQAAKNWGKPLFLRFAHEMNGNWYPWSGYHNGGSASGPENYKRAWRYTYNVREELQADNVNLVWSPNNVSLPAELWNTAEAYYPGDQYLDWIAMDGYNDGYNQWQSFDSVFGSIYAKLISLTNKPLMIGEFACATQEGNKASWITDAFSKIKSNYPRIKIFSWFNINKERDWRVESSTDSLNAFKTALQDSYFLSKID